jgi:hypothetical protein
MMPVIRAPLGTNPGSVPAKAEDLARHLGGRRNGKQWLARCPGHDDRTPSLSIGYGFDGRILVHCHAGCSQDDVIGALRERGLWDEGQRNTSLNVEQIDRRRRDDERRAAERVANVSRIWNEAHNPQDTLAEQYLRSRGLNLPPELCGSVLRFHPACPWEHETIPCLLAAFRAVETDKLTAIHRIRLDQPKRWPKAQRMMLGPVNGSAVKLDPVGSSLAIGEGVETCLAARQLGLRPVWALGSSGAIKTFLPVAGVDELMIIGENDNNGSNRNAADECERSWKPRTVLLVAPPQEFKDFNDLIMDRRK